MEDENEIIKSDGAWYHDAIFITVLVVFFASMIGGGIYIGSLF